MILQSAKMAMKAVLGNKMRSFLTMLGIIIGVFALVVLVSLVNGTTGYVTDTISGLGGSYLTVSVSDDKGKPIKLDDLTAFMDEDAIGLAAPLEQTSATGKYGRESDSIIVYATTPAYQEINVLNVKYGSFLKQTDVDNHNYVAVINETAATDLIGNTDCIGEQITLNGTKFTVVGILSEDDESMTNQMTSDMMVAYIPYTTAQRLSSTISSSITSFYIAGGSDSSADEANARITELLMERFNNDEDAFTISDSSMIEDALSDVTGMLSSLLGGIASISLLVGGIGIMNIMLVSVTERTKEIGIRKAIGAGRGVIMLQFLIEALVISLIGCLMGLLLSGIALAIITSVISDVTFSMSSGVVWIAILFSLAIGVMFGLYPANKAARKTPIEALRHSG